MYLLTCTPNEDSNQSAHPHSLSRVVVVRMKKLGILSCPKYAQLRFWYGCVNAQADRNLRFAHMSEGTFCEVAAHLHVLQFFHLSPAKRKVSSIHMWTVKAQITGAFPQSDHALRCPHTDFRK